MGLLARLKQWIAESIAGQYDRTAINDRIDGALAASPVVMFSFTTCPFCLRAKALLREELGVDPTKLTVPPCARDAAAHARSRKPTSSLRGARPCPHPRRSS